ncbi:hypothetical protein DFJ74DRAFT_675968 [Hyaloraphidium curvatum]|nr:hypothetical protein DFJ74DRAFT_675968 [Hyaloraphidium curvatum]
MAEAARPAVSLSSILDYGDPKGRRFDAWVRRNFGEDAGFKLIQAFARTVVASNFSQVSIRGQYRVPQDGPLVVCVAPHANQFVDPLMVFATMPRPVSFVAARVTCDRLWLGRLCLLARAIPVRRAQDYRKPGQGVVFMPDPEKPTLIRGEGSKFTEQLQLRGGIVLPNTMVLEIANIISDTEVEIKSPPPPAAAALLDPATKTKYKVQPYENQDAVYSTVHALLDAGGALGNFVEGGSHDRSSLLPFKAGAAIMALGAMAAKPGLNVRILPVGLHYFNPDKFRSTASISFGDPISIPQSAVEDYKAGGERKRKAVAQLLSEITDAIKTQTVNAPDYDALIAIQTVRRLVTPINSALSVAQKLDITRRITSYYLAHQDSPGLKALVERCRAYNDELLALDIRDHQVMKAPVGLAQTVGLLGKRLVQLVVGTALAIPGLPLNLPIGILASFIARRKAKEALRASTVKIEGRDVVTSWKLLVILGVTPVWYGVWLAGIDYYLIARRGWSLLKTAIANPFIYAGLWGIGFSNIWFADNMVRTFKSLRAILMSAFNPNRTQALRKKRADLVGDVNKWLDSLPAQDSAALTSGTDGALISREDRAYNEYHTGRLAEGRRPSLDMVAFRTRAEEDERVARSDAELFAANMDEDDGEDHEDVVEVIRRGSILPPPTRPTTPPSKD